MRRDQRASNIGKCHRYVSALFDVTINYSRSWTFPWSGDAKISFLACRVKNQFQSEIDPVLIRIWWFKARSNAVILVNPYFFDEVKQSWQNDLLQVKLHWYSSSTWLTLPNPGFPRGRRQPIIWPIFLQNCIKTRHFGPEGVMRPSPPPPTDPPMSKLVYHLSQKKTRSCSKIRHC